MTLLFALATMLGCFGYLAAEYRKSRLAGWLTKPFASAAFVVLAAFAGAFDSLFGQVLFAGFVLSFFGDVLLLEHATFLFGLGKLCSAMSPSRSARPPSSRPRVPSKPRLRHSRWPLCS